MITVSSTEESRWWTSVKVWWVESMKSSVDKKRWWWVAMEVNDDENTWWWVVMKVNDDDNMWWWVVMKVNDDDNTWWWVVMKVNDDDNTWWWVVMKVNDDDNTWWGEDIIQETERCVTWKRDEERQSGWGDATWCLERELILKRCAVCKRSENEPWACDVLGTQREVKKRSWWKEDRNRMRSKLSSATMKLVHEETK